MFLTIPGNVKTVEMNEAQRRDLAARVKAKRLAPPYRGNRRAAYTAAMVNSATWTNAENGEPMKERSVVAIVGLLWPETGGDWTLIEPPLGEVDLETLTNVETILAELDRVDLSPEARDYIRRKLREAPTSVPEPEPTERGETA